MEHAGSCVRTPLSSSSAPLNLVEEQSPSTRLPDQQRVDADVSMPVPCLSSEDPQLEIPTAITQTENASFDEVCSVQQLPLAVVNDALRSSFLPVHSLAACSNAIPDVFPIMLGQVRAKYVPGRLILTSQNSRTFVVFVPESSPIGPLLSTYLSNTVASSCRYCITACTKR